MHHGIRGDGRPCRAMGAKRSWTGASIPSEAMMHFPPPCFSFPLFSKKFQTLWKIFKILPFPEKSLDFHTSKFLMTFLLVIDRKFRVPPYFPFFPVSVHFPPCFAKIIISPYFEIFSPVFKKYTCFLHICITFPPTLTMMRLCITQCTYWTSLIMDRCICRPTYYTKAMLESSPSFNLNLHDY